MRIGLAVLFDFPVPL